MGRRWLRRLAAIGTQGAARWHGYKHAHASPRRGQRPKAGGAHHHLLSPWATDKPFIETDYSFKLTQAHFCVLNNCLDQTL
jgi:hypothetical protein